MPGVLHAVPYPVEEEHLTAGRIAHAAATV